MTTYVLVPGMWLGAWAWDGVAAPLREGGHEVYPIALTGVGERIAESGPDVNLDTHVADIIEAIGDRTGVVLAGHSYGGLPVRAVADRIPERLARVVYVDSGPLPAGVTQSDMSGPYDAEGGDVPPPSFDVAEDPANHAGLDDAAVALIRRRATTHPLGSVTQPLRLDREEQPPTDLVCCTFSLDAVRGMIAENHPFFAGLDRRDYHLHGLPTGHWPMFSRPADLAETLAALAVPR